MDYKHPDPSEDENEPTTPQHRPKGRMRTARSPEDKQPAPPSSSILPSNPVLPSSSTSSPTSSNSLTKYAFDPLAYHQNLLAHLPLQARIICQAAGNLVAKGYDTFTAKDLTAEAVTTGLVTRQLPERIIAYYLPVLKSKGLLTKV